jgi:hypothetical protein
MPNGRDIFQMSIKCTNIFHSKALQNLPNLEYLVWKYMYHLATLVVNGRALTHRNGLKRINGSPFQKSREADDWIRDWEPLNHWPEWFCVEKVETSNERRGQSHKFITILMWFPISTFKDQKFIINILPLDPLEQAKNS